MISAQVHCLSLKKSFLKDGNRYMKAGNRLDDHNFVTYNDIYPYLVQKTIFGRAWSGCVVIQFFLKIS